MWFTIRWRNDTWRGSLKCLHARGLFVCFGQSSGPISDFKFSDLAAGGSLYATRPTLFDYIKTRADLTARAADLFAKVASGVVQPQIGQRCRCAMPPKRIAIWRPAKPQGPPSCCLDATLP